MTKYSHVIAFSMLQYHIIGDIIKQSDTSETYPAWLTPCTER